MITYNRYRGVTSGTTTAGTLHDEFVQTADTSSRSLATGNNEAIGQSWQAGATPSAVTGVMARLQRSATVRGVVRAAIYAHSGTYGTSSVPTGAPLAFSPWYAAESFSTSATDYWFPISGWTPTGSTNYVVGIEHDIPYSTTGGSAQVLNLIYEDGAEADHGGNLSALLAGSWGASAVQDMPFKVYYAGATPAGILGGDGSTIGSGIRGPFGL